jgi:predicted nucleotidyltransferase
VDSKNFADIDLAIVSKTPVEEKIIQLIREDLEESTLPYKFDVVDINKSNDPFRARVLNGSKIWII